MIADETSDLGKLVSPFLPGSHYNCVFSLLGHLAECSVIATNKHGDAVAIATDLGKSERIIILPQLRDKVEFIRKLVVDFLPGRCPEFFPEFGSKNWVHDPPYELRQVLELDRQAQALKSEYEGKIESLNQQIRDEQEKNGWVYRLLTASGDELVEAVKRALEALGFSNILDVDSERDAQGQSRREDLQILDVSPTLIVDVKGLGSIPGDPDIQQASKHATIRMREWKRIDVISLFIVNHERNVPPLKRTDEPFRPEMITACEDMGTGLLTTWDLYRMVRGHWDNGWPVEHIKPLFYKSGRILPIPAHYHLLGSVAEVFQPAFVLVAKEDLKVGDRLAWKAGTGFVEHTVSSLMVNDKSVPSVVASTEAGIQTNPLHGKLKEGQEIFLVQF